MFQATPCKKNSCLWTLTKTTILVGDVCAVWKMMDGKTRTYFKHNNIETKQVCHKPYPNLLVVAQHENGHRNEPLPQVDEDQENRRPKRKRAVIERYEACPSKESHQMLDDRSDDYRRRNKQKLAIRPRATEFCAGMQKNEARRRCFAAAISNESSLNLPRGGTSKSAKSKHQNVRECSHGIHSRSLPTRCDDKKCHTVQSVSCTAFDTYGDSAHSHGDWRGCDSILYLVSQELNAMHLGNVLG
jgi:hypothetical protein